MRQASGAGSREKPGERSLSEAHTRASPARLVCSSPFWGGQSAMLERVLILPKDDPALDDLAEAITYYGHVEVAYQNGHIASLVETIGIDGVIRLAESDLVDFVYRRSVDGVQTDNALLHPYSFVTITLQSRANGKRIRSVEDELRDAFDQRLGVGVIGRRQVRRLADAIYVREEHPKIIGQAALSDVRDQVFLRTVVPLILKAMAPDYPNISKVNVASIVSNDHFYVDTNIDFSLLNELRRNGGADQNDTIGIANLIVPLIGARAEMVYSGDRRCDIWADDTQSAALRTKVNSFISRLEGGRSNIDRFEEIAFSGRSFSAAISSGERTILDVLDFAEEDGTRRFKKWIKEGPDGGDLLAEYEKSKVVPSKMASSLPAKAAKIVLFSAAGAAIEGAIGGSGAAGAVLGSIVSDSVLAKADELLLSHLKLGWRPNQWVTGPASKFLSQE